MSGRRIDFFLHCLSILQVVIVPAPTKALGSDECSCHLQLQFWVFPVVPAMHQYWINSAPVHTSSPVLPPPDLFWFPKTHREALKSQLCSVVKVCEILRLKKFSESQMPSQNS